MFERGLDVLFLFFNFPPNNSFRKGQKPWKKSFSKHFFEKEQLQVFHFSLKKTLLKPLKCVGGAGSFELRRQ